RGLFGAVLQEVARHPVILAGAGEALDRLAPVASMELGSALARRPDEDGRESLIVGHRHERGLAETRDAFDPNLLRINRLICLEVVETPRRTPRPGAQRSPVIGMSRLSFVDEADDALRQSRTVVSLDAAGIDRGVSPPVRDQLLGC